MKKMKSLILILLISFIFIDKEKAIDSGFPGTTYGNGNKCSDSTGRNCYQYSSANSNLLILQARLYYIEDASFTNMGKTYYFVNKAAFNYLQKEDNNLNLIYDSGLDGYNGQDKYKNASKFLRNNYFNNREKATEFLNKVMDTDNYNDALIKKSEAASDNAKKGYRIMIEAARIYNNPAFGSGGSALITSQGIAAENVITLGKLIEDSKVKTQKCLGERNNQTNCGNGRISVMGKNSMADELYLGINGTKDNLGIKVSNRMYTKNNLKAYCESLVSSQIADVKIGCGYDLIDITKYTSYSCYKAPNVIGDNLTCINYDKNNTKSYEEQYSKRSCDNLSADDISMYNQYGRLKKTIGTCKLYCKEKATISLPGNILKAKLKGSYFAWPSSDLDNGKYVMKINATVSCKIIDTGGESVAAVFKRTCKDGYKPEDGECISTNETQKICEDGVEAESGKCYKFTQSKEGEIYRYDRSEPKCESGYKLSSDKTYCYKLKSDLYCNGKLIYETMDVAEIPQNGTRCCPENYEYNIYSNAEKPACKRIIACPDSHYKLIGGMCYKCTQGVLGKNGNEYSCKVEKSSGHGYEYKSSYLKSAEENPLTKAEVWSKGKPKEIKSNTYCTSPATKVETECRTKKNIPTCESGYSYQKDIDKCVKCESGYEYIGAGKCRSIKVYKKICPKDGRAYIDRGNVCYHITPEISSSYSCPYGYTPTGDTKERKCKNTCDKTKLNEKASSTGEEINFEATISGGTHNYIDNQKLIVTNASSKQEGLNYTKQAYFILPDTINRYYNRKNGLVLNSKSNIDSIFDRKEGVISTNINDKNGEYPLKIKILKLGTDSSQIKEKVKDYICHYSVTDISSCTCPEDTKNAGNDVEKLVKELYNQSITKEKTCGDWINEICDEKNIPTSYKCENGIDITNCVINKNKTKTLEESITICKNANKCNDNTCTGECLKKSEKISNIKTNLSFTTDIIYSLTLCNGKFCSFDINCENENTKPSVDSNSCISEKLGEDNIVDALNNDVSIDKLKNAIKECNVCNTKQKTVFRIIDLKNPFPGKEHNNTLSGFSKEGKSRTPGYNWNSKTFVKNKILNNRGVSDYKLYSKEPLYKITLTPSVIREIRNYNKYNQYNNFNMKCTNNNTSNCISRFLHEKNSDINLKVEGISPCMNINLTSDKQQFDACYNSNN